MAACPRCGTGLSPGARFCSRCGNTVVEDQANVSTAELEAVVGKKLSKSQSEALARLRSATVGEYEIIAELGRGGMAAVYLAHDIMLDRKVAIKIMSPAVAADEGNVERFKREARTAAKLSHPHIIPIHAVRETDDVPYFVMKYVEGRPLDSIIRDVGRLPIKMIQAILTQVGSALGYAHRMGVVHRDIKPANVMIDTEGYAVVADFGIAKVLEAPGLTQTNATVGTPQYMSPEQGGGSNITGASDQYSLGIMGYEMLTGRLPFTADSVVGVMMKHATETPPPIDRTDCPPTLRDAIMRMLAKRPAERWASMEEAVSAIGLAPLAHDDPVVTQMGTLAKSGARIPRAALPETPGSPSPPAKPFRKNGPAVGRTAPPAPDRTRRWLGLAAAVVVLVGGGFLARTWLIPGSTPADSTLSALPTGASDSTGPLTPDTSGRAAPVATGDTSGPGGAQSAAVPPAPDSTRLQVAPPTGPDPAELRRRRDSIAAVTRRRDSISAFNRRRDSLDAAQRRDSIATANAPPPVRSTKAWIKIGTRRTPPGVLNINGVPQGMNVSIAYFQVNAGTVRITVQPTAATGCTPWDSTFTIAAGDSLPIGYRNPTCSP